jgi:hypothetical protein
MIGLLLAFANSFAEAGVNLVSQQFKIPPRILTIYRGLGVAICLLPFLIFIEYPKSYLFYFFILLNGIVASYSARKKVYIINTFGADITSKFLTVPPVIGALMWWVINPVLFADLMNNHAIKGFFAILCLLGMLFSIFFLGKRKATKQALFDCMPVFFCQVTQTFLCFFAIREVNLLQAMFYYVFLQGLIIGVINYFLYIKHLSIRNKDQILLKLFEKRTVFVGFVFVFIVIIARFSSNLAFKYLDNPSYVVLISNMQILWIYLFGRHYKISYVISPIKGVLLAVFSVMFILLTYSV